MNIVLLSGGSGKRLWPLSNDVRSKQFIKMFKKPDGSYESMVQRVYRQIKEVSPDATVTVATAKTQVSAIHNQLGEDVGVSVEPARRDTFPAIALATAYLHDVQGLSEDEVVIVCPVDPYVESDYFAALLDLEKMAKEGKSNLTLMGMEPTYPSAKYGYIMVNPKDLTQVDSFKEKPDEETAEKYIASGALWNGGIFAYKIGYVLDIARKLLSYTTYQDLYDRYDTLEKISFDYAVVEKESKIRVMKFSGSWKDVGTWNTLAEVMDEPTIGDVRCDDTCDDINVINDLDVPIVCMGIKNMIVAASPEGILVSDKHESSYIKPFVDKIDQDIRFAEKSWGTYAVIDVEENSLTVKVTLNASHEMHYHKHERRDEVWTIVSGEGEVLVDGVSKAVKAGDVVEIPVGVAHKLVAITDLVAIEVQVGTDISVSDKIKLD